MRQHRIHTEQQKVSFRITHSTHQEQVVFLSKLNVHKGGGGQGCPIYCVLFPKTPREKQQQKITMTMSNTSELYITFWTFIESRLLKFNDSLTHYSVAGTWFCNNASAVPLALRVMCDCHRCAMGHQAFFFSTFTWTDHLAPHSIKHLKQMHIDFTKNRNNRSQQ